MEQVKVILVSLLPVLWLVGSEFSGSGTAITCADSLGQTLTSPGAPDSKGPLRDAFVRDQSGRSLSRRLGSHSGSTGFNPAFATYGCELVESEPAKQISPKRGAPADLASSWQFYFRTALTPRAPSSVS